MYYPTDGTFVDLGGIIRLGAPTTTHPLGPYIHENSTHANVGIIGLSIDGGGYDLIVDMIPTPGGKIVKADAGKDETLAELGISAGVSGGIGATTIRLYDKNRVPVKPTDPRFGAYANIWFGLKLFVPNP
jgi:hypothetical protein